MAQENYMLYLEEEDILNLWVFPDGLDEDFVPTVTNMIYSGTYPITTITRSTDSKITIENLEGIEKIDDEYLEAILCYFGLNNDQSRVGRRPPSSVTPPNH